MGIFSSYLRNLSEDATVRRPRRVSYFNELNVNGQPADDDEDDFTTDEAADDEEAPAPEANQEQPEGGDNPPPEGEADNANVDDAEEGDEDDDFTLPEGQEEGQGDVEEEPVENAEGEGEEGGEEDNFTLQGEENTDEPAEGDVQQDEVQEQPAGDEEGGDVPQDQPPQDGAEADQGGEAEGGEPPAEGEGGEDDNFTLQGNEGGGEEGGDPGAQGGEEGQEGGDNGGGGNKEPAPPTDPTDNISDEDVKASEEQIYDSLTDDQKRIRTFNLKVQYKGIYEAIMTMVDNLNNIPKSADNLETLKKVITYSNKVKEILIDYIQYNFDKNPYLENYATYIKFMAIFRTISRVIEDMNTQKEKNKK